MLFPRSHDWTPTQKRLIISAVIFGLAALTTIIYGYERYYRGPGQEVLCGTWEIPNFPTDYPMYFRFDPDGAFFLTSAVEDEPTPSNDGRWYAGGNKIYIRFNENLQGMRLLILHIVEIRADEFRVRYTHDGRVHTYHRKRRDSLIASNQPMPLRVADQILVR